MNNFKLSLIVGGVQKAGTTSLYGYLSEHPSLLPPRAKELHFFDDESIDWQAPDYSTLTNAFRQSIDNRLPFDVTPIYLFWPPSLDRIRNYNPDVRLIFIFRDPVERAWSHWRMEYARGAETLAFDQAIREGRRRLRGVPLLDPAWRVYSYVERGFYGAQVTRLLRKFRRENVLFLRSADLLSDHLNTLNTIATFLDIPLFPDIPPRVDHRSKPTEATLADEDIAYLRGLFQQDLLEFWRLTGLRVSDWLPLSVEPQGGQ